MALERQDIEKKDFPLGRRGYDPEAVDAHLAQVAAELERLRKESRRRSETLASAASQQVQAIVEAAEATATDIQSQAEEDARETREEAEAEATRTRQEATDQAREYVGKVSEGSSTLLGRVDAMESELSGLLDQLRTGANRLNADLALLEGNVAELREATGVRERFEPEEPAPSTGERATDSAIAAGGSGGSALLEDDADLSSEADLAAAAPVAGPDTEVSDDSEGARLIALDMALNGSPREETDAYLAENYDLADRQALLDEVYASVDG